MLVKRTHWFVAFVDTDCRLWWHRPLKPGFRHLLAFAPEGADQWVVYEPGFDGMQIHVLTRAQIVALTEDIKKRRGGTIVRAPVVGNAPQRPYVLATCVTAIKALLSVRCCAVTPWGLYRKLLAHGAVPAFEED